MKLGSITSSLGWLALSGGFGGSSFCDSMILSPSEAKVQDSMDFDYHSLHSHPSSSLSFTRMKLLRTIVKKNPVADLAWKVGIYLECPRGRFIFSLT